MSTFIHFQPVSRALLIVSLFTLPPALLGCPKEPGPVVNVPAPVETSAPSVSVVAASTTAPLVLFTASDNILAPVLCHNGKELIASDSEECLGLAPEGASVFLSTGQVVKLGSTTEAPCQGSGVNNFSGRKATPNSDLGSYGIWPESAKSAIVRKVADLEPSEKELAALVKLLQKETERESDPPPKVMVTGGLTLDMDGDGQLDKVFAIYANIGLYGLVATFLGKSPDSPTTLSAMQYDFPKLVGYTDLDGKPGHEVWISAQFVEGIDGQTLASAISERLMALDNGKPAEVGSWGCRMF
ncbi:MAG: hypothetical protein IPK82_42265 [Polyangiaceae bacterium]|nr:hypothetical protein [Polyangiaceae bacterium]